MNLNALVIQRYDPTTIYGSPDMRLEENGEYVRYADIEPLLSLAQRHIERVALQARPPVIMCGCDDYVTCKHPWPQMVRLP